MIRPPVGVRPRRLRVLGLKGDKAPSLGHTDALLIRPGPLYIPYLTMRCDREQKS